MKTADSREELGWSPEVEDFALGVIAQIDSEAARLGISELIEPVLTEQSPADQLTSIIKNNLLRSLQLMAYHHNATTARL